MPIDAKRYETIADLDAARRAGSPRPPATGRVAIDTETTSVDPMRADLVGISLATAPGQAAYVPLGHRTGDTDLLGGGLLAGPDPGGARRSPR